MHAGVPGALTHKVLNMFQRSHADWQRLQQTPSTSKLSYADRQRLAPASLQSVRLGDSRTTTTHAQCCRA